MRDQPPSWPSSTLAGDPAYEAALLPGAIANLKELVTFAMLPNGRPRDRQCWNAIRKAISDEVAHVGTYGLAQLEDSKCRYAFRLEYAALCLAIAPNFARETSWSTDDPIVDRPGWIKAIGLAICRFSGWIDYIALIDSSSLRHRCATPSLTDPAR